MHSCDRIETYMLNIRLSGGFIVNLIRSSMLARHSIPLLDRSVGTRARVYARYERQGVYRPSMSVQLWKINWRSVTRGDGNIVPRRINFLCDSDQPLTSV